MKTTHIFKSSLVLIFSCLSFLNIGQTAACYSSRIDYNTSMEQNFMCQDDFDNDGNLDIVTSNQLFPNSGISFLKGNLNGIFSSPINTTFSLTAGGLASGDFNNDGNKDLVLVFTGNNSLGFISGNGNGTFNIPVYFSAGIGVENISSADFNNDGNLDLVTTNPTNFTVKVFLGNGNGTFQSGVLCNVGNYPRSVVIEDLNGDNNNDLVVVNSSSPYSISVLMGAGTGLFGAQTTYSVGNDPRYAVISDLNNDGSKDIAVCNSGSSSFSILTGNGTGLFSAAISHTLPTISPTCLVAEDFNLDGIVDLAFSHANLSFNMNVTIMHGMGNATFMLKNQLFTAANHLGSFILSGDYNSDGKSDISLANYLGYNMSVFLNDNTLISANSPTICSGQTAVIIPTGASSYSITGGTFSVTPNSTTNYTVSGTSNGCSNSVAINVVVNTTPSLSVSATSTAICSGQTATLTASGANSYTWAAGPNLPSYIVNASGIYSVTGSSSSGCATTKTVEILVNALPSLSISATSTAICSGQTATLTASGANSYSWTAGPSTPSYVVNASGIYTVTGTDFNSCASSSTLEIAVNSLPTLQVNSTSTLLCIGSSATVSAVGANNYTWSTGDNSTQIIVSPSSTTVYTVTATDLNNCSSSQTYTIQVSLCTSINKVEESLAFKIYPNPVNSYLFVKGLPVNSTIEIKDMLGKINHTNLILLEDGNFMLNLSDFPKGIYYISIYDKGRLPIKTEKVVIY